jgi:hypothetical protein
MPKQHSKAVQRKRLKVEAKQQCTSVSEVKQRLKSDGNGDNPAIPPEDNIIVSCDTYDNSLECPNSASNTSNVSIIVTTYTTCCPVEENLAIAGTVATVPEHNNGESIECKGGEAERAQVAVDAHMVPVILAPDVKTLHEVRGAGHGVQEGGDAQAAKIVSHI